MNNIVFLGYYEELNSSEEDESPSYSAYCSYGNTFGLNCGQHLWYQLPQQHLWYQLLQHLDSYCNNNTLIATATTTPLYQLLRQHLDSYATTTPWYQLLQQHLWYQLLQQHLDSYCNNTFDSNCNNTFGVECGDNTFGNKCD